MATWSMLINASTRRLDLADLLLVIVYVVN